MPTVVKLSPRQTEIAAMAYLLSKAFLMYSAESVGLAASRVRIPVKLHRNLSMFDYETGTLFISKASIKSQQAAVVNLIHESVHGILSTGSYEAEDYLEDHVQLTREIIERCKESIPKRLHKIALYDVCIEETLASIIEYVCLMRVLSVTGGPVSVDEGYVPSRTLKKWYNAGYITKIYKKFMTVNHRSIMLKLGNKLTRLIKREPNTDMDSSEFAALIHRILMGRVSIKTQSPVKLA